ncbi:MAG: tetratricopeptide repeat protein [Melioribacteraceae bacterium]|nr:tetratricopeptide repeat protein [Melioribacteraceae bacterium]
MKKSTAAKPPKWFYLILIVIPILFFVLLEISLRLAGYGTNIKPWIPINSSRLILNPEIAKKYFGNTQNIPFATEAIIDKNKKENSLRIFVLGGSSAAGYPYLSSASFAKYIRKGLNFTYPDKTIEVVNVSMSAINTYTLKDILPDVIEKEPDAILIYAGHNEYYGALGVASTESMGSTPFLINLMLEFDDLKTVQLTKNIIAGIFSSVSNTNSDTGTLMARISEGKLVPFKSDLFDRGIEQFENNLDEMLKLINENNIPVYISTLVSNIRDQSPFVSNRSYKYPSADSIYNKALELKSSGIIEDSLFVFAKDLDELRFRAPEDINKKIITLGTKYNCKIIRGDLLFKNYALEGLVGNDLMIDHLHLNVKGYQLLGKFFLERILKSDNSKLDLNIRSLHSKILKNYNFTKYDSVTASYRIKILKSDWPFNKTGNKTPRDKLIIPQNTIEKTALAVIDSKISRKDAREKVADYYLKNDSLDLFITEMIALKEEFPFLKISFDKEVQQFLKEKKYDNAFKLLKESYKLSPNAFSAKWIGIILLSKKNPQEAIKYLNRSLSFSPNDPQVLFNLAGAYSDTKNYDKALESIEKCLRINPNDENAKNMCNQLKKVKSR